MARKKAGQHGGHGWFVTFADLMALLVAFFVMLVAFSSTDQNKMQLVAGSMRDAFGVQPIKRRAGMIEKDGVPVRDYLKSVGQVPKDGNSEFASDRHDEHESQGPEANTYEVQRNEIERPRSFALAAASLRQAWGELPEITELSENLIMEETKDGLHIQIVDQEGRSMFPQGSSEPYPRIERLLAKMAPVLRSMPNRIAITGYTDATKPYGKPDLSLWDVSADRAKAARRVLAANGVPHDRFYSVAGRADAEPLYPEDPFLAANRRISILLMAEAPPFPAEAKP